MQAFYGAALQALSLHGKADVWEGFQQSQEALGSAGLYDPRWHPKIVIRGKTLGKNLQDNVDYYVSSQPAPF